MKRPEDGTEPPAGHHYSTPIPLLPEFEISFKHLFPSSEHAASFITPDENLEITPNYRLDDQPPITNLDDIEVAPAF